MVGSAGQNHGVAANRIMLEAPPQVGSAVVSGPEDDSTAECLWYVAHTRPRCEKKLSEFCERAGITPTLPLYRSVKKYRGKTVVFEKPLFPGYVFVRMPPASRQGVLQSDYVANLLDVPIQDEFETQLTAILQALTT
ncbi:MAG: UpxY family transcription antiterminator, partial [Verrucomicrobiales bacterium]|nr:UpxY family transcription antiterminator [Verrucomicrobiales bacterium]